MSHDLTWEDDDGNGFSTHWDIPEWWDEEGNHHEGEPTADELENFARQVTVHAWDDDGNDIHFTSFSPDGWLEDELEVDIEDAWEYYV